MGDLRTVRHLAVLLSVFLFLGPIGCRRADLARAPDYARPLPPGVSGLRKIIDRAQLPDLTAAYSARSDELVTALDRSLAWFEYPSIRSFFKDPALLAGTRLTPEHAQASVLAFREILNRSRSASEFQRRFHETFDTYMSVGWNGSGTVLFTGYYTPEFRASRQRTNEFRYPLYQRPRDLVSDPGSGRVLGRRVGETIRPYPTRAQIESSGLLAGQELVYLEDPFDAYIVHVNGSARLQLSDGRSMHVGYAGNNGHEYTSVGRALVDMGKIDPDRLNLATLRAYFRDHPEEVEFFTGLNDRFVFFSEYEGQDWPAGSLGFKVTSMRTLATDKQVFPRGGVVLVLTRMPRPGPLGSTIDLSEPLEQFMLDQDTGGAIRAAGRADIYMGEGAKAEALAGRQVAEGLLFYFFLKPHRVEEWVSRLPSVHQRAGIDVSAR